MGTNGSQTMDSASSFLSPDQFAALDTVSTGSYPAPEGLREVTGLDFDNFTGRDISAAEMVAEMASMGFQATSVGEAARIINGMVSLFIFI